MNMIREPKHCEVIRQHRFKGTTITALIDNPKTTHQNMMRKMVKAAEAKIGNSRQVVSCMRSSGSDVMFTVLQKNKVMGIQDTAEAGRLCAGDFG